MLCSPGSFLAVFAHQPPERGFFTGQTPRRYAHRGAILGRFSHHAPTIAINGRSDRLKNHATAAGKEDKSKKAKSKSNDTSAAEPAS